MFCFYTRWFQLNFFFFFQAEDGIRDKLVTGVQTCALPIYRTDTSRMFVDMLTTAFSMGDLRAAARGALAEALKHYSPADTVLHLMSKVPPQKMGLVNTMRYLDLKLTLAGDILVKVDRASMAVSL